MKVKATYKNETRDKLGSIKYDKTAPVVTISTPNIQTAQLVWSDSLSGVKEIYLLKELNTAGDYNGVGLLWNNSWHPGGSTPYSGRTAVPTIATNVANDAYKVYEDQSGTEYVTVELEFVDTAKNTKKVRVTNNTGSWPSLSNI